MGSSKNGGIYYKIEVLCPEEYVDRIAKAACELGAGRIGSYDRITTYYEIKGTWRPLGDSNPVTGQIGTINSGVEYKLEMRCEEKYMRDVMKAINNVHPYEEVVINVIRLDNHLFE